MGYGLFSLIFFLPVISRVSNAMTTYLPLYLIAIRQSIYWNTNTPSATNSPVSSLSSFANVNSVNPPLPSSSSTSSVDYPILLPPVEDDKPHSDNAPTESQGLLQITYSNSSLTHLFLFTILFFRTASYSSWNSKTVAVLDSIRICYVSLSYV